MNISDFSLAYQKSPIIFVNGIANSVTGGLLPIISITQPNGNASVSGGAVTTSITDLSDFLFDFYPMPGGTLIENQVATYPFANQQIAANAIIAEPLRISLMMLSPVSGDNGGYDNKASVFQTLQTTLAKHTQLGGLFNVATPSYLYTNLILTALRDVSDGDPKRPQSRWQWDFFAPLLTLQAAQAAQNNLMTALTNGGQVTPNANGVVAWSGPQVATGNPASTQAPSAVPLAQNLPGASVGTTPQKAQ